MKSQTKSGFLQSERLGSGKILSELHIHYKPLLKWVYNHAGAQNIWKYFTFALKIIDVIDKKQMHGRVITGKENACKQWNCITVYRCFWRVLMSVLCLVMHVLCVYASKLLSGFLGQGLAFFGEDRLATLLCHRQRWK